MSLPPYRSHPTILLFIAADGVIPAVVVVVANPAGRDAAAAFTLKLGLAAVSRMRYLGRSRPLCHLLSLDGYFTLM